MPIVIVALLAALAYGYSQSQKKLKPLNPALNKGKAAPAVNPAQAVVGGAIGKINSLFPGAQRITRMFPNAPADIANTVNGQTPTGLVAAAAGLFKDLGISQSTQGGGGTGTPQAQAQLQDSAGARAAQATAAESLSAVGGFSSLGADATNAGGAESAVDQGVDSATPDLGNPYSNTLTPGQTDAQVTGNDPAAVAGADPDYGVPVTPQADQSYSPPADPDSYVPADPGVDINQSLDDSLTDWSGN